MTEFIRQGEADATSFNRTHQLQPKVTTTEKECKLVTITKSNKDNHWQPRNVTVEPEPSPEPKQRTWLKAMRAKELEAIKYRNVHLKQAYAAKASGTPSLLSKIKVKFVPL